MATTKAKGKKTGKPGNGSPAGSTVACWEDDPGDSLHPAVTPITVPAPNQSAQPLPFKIGGTAPPVQVYNAGTPNFRYYAAAAALRRTSDFWGSIIGAGATWNVGKTLPVILDDGVDLNAFYTRGDFQEAAGLHFFHDTLSGKTYFSGESPDVVCHEMGHAVLDAIRPQLFDAQTIEAAAFHESFGDMTAILSGLQVASFRQAVLAETGGVLNRNSRLSRLAEQLGEAIRLQHPDAVDRDALRNAANSFFYKDPQLLPTSAPSAELSSEPHSFSRVFTAGFLDALAGMLKLQSGAPTSADLLKTSQDAAQLLVSGILSAPVAPDYYSQVAAHMLAVSQEAPGNGKYSGVIKSAFVRRGILSLAGAATVGAGKPQSLRKAAFAALRDGTQYQLPKASIAAGQYGLNSKTLLVHTAEEAKRFAVTSASPLLGALEPRSAQNAAEAFTEDLFQRGRVDVREHADPAMGPVHQHSFRTHVIVEDKGELLLKRRAFDCGFVS